MYSTKESHSFYTNRKVTNHHLGFSRASSLTPPSPSPYPWRLPNPSIISAATLSGGHNPMEPTTNSPSPITPSPEDQYLSNSSHLSREHVLTRRSHHIHQLSNCYRDHYWALMEDVRLRYREYIWKFGITPFQQDSNQHHNNNVKLQQGIDERIVDVGDVSNALLCVFTGCNMKAMTLTRFCHLHILSDPNQQLYKPCEFLLKSAHAGLAPCGKPVLRSIVPSLCSMHFLKAQQHVVRALRKAGLNITSMNKSGPKFHVIVTEYVREIQEKRKKNGSMANKKKIVPKLEIEN